jgi:hypothetical protein
VPYAILASVPDNTQGGANLTFVFPLLLFCVIGAVLYIVVFARPHARVPARRVAAVSHAGPPSPEAAHAAAIAAGLPLAEGGGSAESGAEGAGALSAALAQANPDVPPELASDEAAEGSPATEDTPPAGDTSPPDDEGAGT